MSQAPAGGSPRSDLAGVLARETLADIFERPAYPNITAHTWWGREPTPSGVRGLLLALRGIAPADAAAAAEEPWVPGTPARLADATRRAVAGAGRPVVLDPFAGSGTTAMEAARLGFDAVAADVDPVAGAILRSTLELPSEHGPELTKQLDALVEDWADAVAPIWPAAPDGTAGWLLVDRVECPDTGRPTPVVGRAGPAGGPTTYRGGEVTSTWSGTRFPIGAGRPGHHAAVVVARVTGEGPSARWHAVDEPWSVPPPPAGRSGPELPPLVEAEEPWWGGGLLEDGVAFLLAEVAAAVEPLLDAAPDEDRAALALLAYLVLAKVVERSTRCSTWDDRAGRPRGALDAMVLRYDGTWFLPHAPHALRAAAAEVGAAFRAACDLATSADARPARVLHGPSQRLALEPATVDLVLTSPPYYDTVRYGDRSAFYLPWLAAVAGRWHGDLLDRAAGEAVPERDADPAAAARAYHRSMRGCLDELHRVLAADGRLAFYFSHRRLDVCVELFDAGFAIDDVVVLARQSEEGVDRTHHNPVHYALVIVCSKRVPAADPPDPSDDPVGDCVAEALAAAGPARGVERTLAVNAAVLRALSDRWASDPLGLAEGAHRDTAVERALDRARTALVDDTLARLFGPDRGRDVDAATRFTLVGHDEYGAPAIPLEEADKLARALGQPSARATGDAVVTSGRWCYLRGDGGPGSHLADHLAGADRPAVVRALLALGRHGTRNEPLDAAIRRAEAAR